MHWLLATGHWVLATGRVGGIGAYDETPVESADDSDPSEYNSTEPGVTMDSRRSAVVHRGNSIISIETLPDYPDPVAVKKPSDRSSVAYISPKQTGRINRTGKECSDLCLLGVVLCELRHPPPVLEREGIANPIEPVDEHSPATARGTQVLVDGLRFGQIRDSRGDEI